MFKMSRRSAVGLVAALALSGCASSNSYPYAELTGRTGASPGLDISSVDITGIDGRILFDKKTWREIEPGPHYLMVLTTRKVRRGDQQPAYLPLLAEPCVRYYIVARHATGIDATDWAPEIARTEPIEGCKAEEKKIPGFAGVGGESPIAGAGAGATNSEGQGEQRTKEATAK